MYHGQKIWESVFNDDNKTFIPWDNHSCSRDSVWSSLLVCYIYLRRFPPYKLIFEEQLPEFALLFELYINKEITNLELKNSMDDTYLNKSIGWRKRIDISITEVNEIHCRDLVRHLEDESNVNALLTRIEKQVFHCSECNHDTPRSVPHDYWNILISKLIISILL